MYNNDNDNNNNNNLKTGSSLHKEWYMYEKHVAFPLELPIISLQSSFPPATYKIDFWLVLAWFQLAQKFQNISVTPSWDRE